MRSRIKKWRAELREFGRHTLWNQEYLDKGPLHRFGVILIRSAVITFNGIIDNQLLTKAAALSYYSLIGMGPMVAIVVMVSSFMVKEDDPGLAVRGLNDLLEFVAPPVVEYDRVDDALIPDEPPADGDAEDEIVLSEKAEGELAFLLNTMIESARSKTVGIFGALMLVFIAVQLLTSVEKVFNDIWGCRQGRSWGERLVFYWTFISLGAMLGIGALGLLSASAIAQLFDLLPFGTLFAKAFLFAGPLLSFLFLLGLLMGFYRFFPNTPVTWRAGLAGAFVAAILLISNHVLSIIYVHKVIESRSLYGSVGIIPVLMLGLYVFWFFVLVGAQITYAVQNVHYLTNQQAWKHISTRTRELLAAGALILVSRRFRDCGEPYSVTQLATDLHAPAHLLNEALTKLCDLNLLTSVIPIGGTKKHSPHESTCYQPARPLDKITFSEFKNAFELSGGNRGEARIENADPLLKWYKDRIEALPTSELSTRTLDELFSEKLKR